METVAELMRTYRERSDQHILQAVLLGNVILNHMNNLKRRNKDINHLRNQLIVIHLLNSCTVCFFSCFCFTNCHISNTSTNCSCHRIRHANIQPSFPFLDGQMNSSGYKKQKLIYIDTHIYKRAN